jgi:hypothetical protein
MLLMDNEFESLVPLLPSIVANTTAAREHVSEVERQIRTIKERGGGIKNTLPFAKLPKLMIIEMINFVVMWLNAFPSKSGIFERYSPRELILRRKLTFEKHCRVPFGTYCEVADNPTMTNVSDSRTTPAIALGPTGNAQGTYKFLSLATGKKINRRTWTRLPIPDSMINKLHRLAARDGNLGNLAFANRHGDLFAWNDDVDAEMGENLVTPEISSYPDIPVEFPGVELERDIPITAGTVIDEAEIPGVAEHIAAANAGLLEDDGTGDQPIVIEHDDGDVDPPQDDDGIIAINAGPIGGPAPQNVVEVNDDSDNASFTSAAQEWDDLQQHTDAGDETNPTTETDANDDTAAENEEHFKVEDVDEEEDDEDYGEPAPRRSARQNKGQQKPRPYDEYLNQTSFSFFSHAKEVSNAQPVDREEWMDWALGVALMQYSIKAGLKKFGEKGEAVVTKELKQLHDMTTFYPVDSKTLTKEDKARAIASLMFLKEKRDGTVEGRACADGQKQS